VGAYSIVLISPNSLVLVLAVALVPAGWYGQADYGYASYALFAVSLAYSVWAIFELLRHNLRLGSDPDYRRKYEHFRGRGRDGDA
jgi:hypothetical protein